jgi:hypothetical protein
MVKISSNLRRFSLDGKKENERDFVETEIIAEPGDEVGEITTIDGDRFINGKWYMTGNSTKEGEFEYVQYSCEFCGAISSLSLTGRVVLDAFLVV